MAEFKEHVIEVAAATRKAADELINTYFHAPDIFDEHVNYDVVCVEKQEPEKAGVKPRFRYTVSLRKDINVWGGPFITSIDGNPLSGGYSMGGED